MAKIRVSQATIDKIKKMGMTRALAGTGSANAEMREALTRMYGARRVAAATPKAAAPSTQRKYGTPNVTSKPKMVDAKGPNAVGKKEEPSTRRKYGTPNVTSKSQAAKTAAEKKLTANDRFANSVVRAFNPGQQITAKEVRLNAAAKKRAANKNK